MAGQGIMGRATQTLMNEEEIVAFRPTPTEIMGHARRGLYPLTLFCHRLSCRRAWLAGCPHQLGDGGWGGRVNQRSLRLRLCDVTSAPLVLGENGPSQPWWVPKGRGGAEEREDTATGLVGIPFGYNSWRGGVSGCPGHSMAVHLDTAQCSSVQFNHYKAMMGGVLPLCHARDGDSPGSRAHNRARSNPPGRPCGGGLGVESAMSALGARGCTVRAQGYGAPTCDKREVTTPRARGES